MMEKHYNITCSPSKFVVLPIVQGKSLTKTSRLRALSLNKLAESISFYHWNLLLSSGSGYVLAIVNKNCFGFGNNDQKQTVLKQTLGYSRGNFCVTKRIN